MNGGCSSVADDDDDDDDYGKTHVNNRVRLRTHHNSGATQPG